MTIVAYFMIKSTILQKLDCLVLCHVIVGEGKRIRAAELRQPRHGRTEARTSSTVQAEAPPAATTG